MAQMVDRARACSAPRWLLLRIGALYTISKEKGGRISAIKLVPKGRKCLTRFDHRRSFLLIWARI